MAKQPETAQEFLNEAFNYFSKIKNSQLSRKNKHRANKEALEREWAATSLVEIKKGEATSAEGKINNAETLKTTISVANNEEIPVSVKNNYIKLGAFS